MVFSFMHIILQLCHDYKNYSSRDGQMAQLVKYLQNKHEDLCLDPLIHGKDRQAWWSVPTT